MTNAQIIFSESLELMEAGKIGTTGRTLTLERPDGTRYTVPEPEPIHTFAAWRALGYTVRKGEKATAAFSIWKQGKASKAAREAAAEAGEEEPAGRMFMKLSHFFTAAQVEKLTR
jgi:hypothetical protein